MLQRVNAVFHKAHSVGALYPNWGKQVLLTRILHEILPENYLYLIFQLVRNMFTVISQTPFGCFDIDNRLVTFHPNGRSRAASIGCVIKGSRY